MHFYLFEPLFVSYRPWRDLFLDTFALQYSKRCCFAPEITRGVYHLGHRNGFFFRKGASLSQQTRLASHHYQLHHHHCHHHYYLYHCNCHHGHIIVIFIIITIIVMI